METLLIYAAGYVVSTIISAGWQLAYFDGKYPGDYRENLSFALGWSLFGMVLWPVTLPISFFTSSMAQYGWRLKPKL